MYDSLRGLLNVSDRRKYIVHVLVQHFFSVQNCLVCGMEADEMICVMMNMITIQTSSVLLYFVLWYVNTKLCIA